MRGKINFFFRFIILMIKYIFLYRKRSLYGNTFLLCRNTLFLCGKTSYLNNKTDTSYVSKMELEHNN